MDSQALSVVLSELEPIIKARHARCVSRYSRRFDVDDLFQVTCMKAHMGLDKVRAETPQQLRHWILTIAKSSLLTAIATEHAQKRDIRLEADSDQWSRTLAPEVEQTNTSQLDEHLRRASANSQTALRLRYLESKSYAEISDHMGITENAVRLLVSRGLKAIRKAVTEDTDEP